MPARFVLRVYVGVAALGVLAFLVGGTLLAVTLPYHQWDSFGFGDWSRAIALHGKVDPAFPGPQESARPLFYELQGLLWWIFGVGFTAGRVLSLVFALVLVGGVVAAARAVTETWLEPALAALAVVSIAPFEQQSLSGQTDVPSAATIALAAALTLRKPRSRRGQAALVVAATAAVLTKQTAFLALVPLALVLLIGPRTGLRSRLARGPAALAGGLLLGFVYDVVLASRFGTDVLTYLRVGTTGIWGTLAAQTRHDALLRADVLGSGLRLPLTFSLVYGALRVVGLRHRLATPPALAAGLAWSVGGPLGAGIAHGAFATLEDAFTLIGFAFLLAASMFLADGAAPARWTLAVALALALPPLAAWADTATYADRLASSAWPGLALLLGCTLAAGVRGLLRLGATSALAPATVLAVAAWMSLATLDGLHGSMWTEYRSLGWAGLGDRTRTMHVVLPTIEDSLALAEPQLGTGRLIAGDPTFAWFLPTGRVTSTTPEHCRDVSGYRIFVLSTSNEAEQEARDLGGLATPADWAACKAPKLTQLSDGSNGYAVFSVSSA